MAKKYQPPEKPKKKDDGSKDLETLHPERTIKIGGKAITVREYGFVEGMTLHRQVQPIVDALAKAAVDDERNGGDGSVDQEAINLVLADNVEGIVLLIASSIRKDQGWVRALGDSEGQLLKATWWAVNSGFFVRRVLRVLSVAAAKTAAGRKQAAASAGETSTPPSSHTATTSPSSGATPAAS